MKLGTLTYHAALNYGAVLQCYALKKSLEQLGHEVRVINYVDQNQADNASMYRHGSGLRRVAMNAAFVPFHFVRKQKAERFRAFRDSELGLTQRAWDADSLAKIIDDEGFDAIIVGSDQVWNPHIKDFTENFFLPFETNAKKIGYAISTGGSTIDDLLPYKEHVARFDFVSVRETATAALLERLANVVAPVAIDPVFLLDKNEWLKMAVGITHDEPYLVCYFMNKGNMGRCVRMADRIARERGLRIVRINSAFTKESLSREVIFDAGIREFLGLFAEASAVCTDSFHGTAFSVIFEKEFYSIDYLDAGHDSRKSSLLQKIGLDERLLFVNETNPTIRKSADYSASRKELTSLIEQSKSYLTNSLAGLRA